MDYENAAKDAALCVQKKPDFTKGWFRLANAHYEMGDYGSAADAILSGTKYDSKGNVFDMLRGEIAYHHYYTTAKKAIKNGEFKKALATIKAGQKIDFNNEKLKEILKDAEKGVEQEEKAARKGMARDELLKSEGNDLFKEAQFDQAIEKYTKAIECLKDPNGKVAVACYNNRAACYQQQSNYQGVIEDTSRVLEIDENNEKALLRRGLSFEGMEKFKLALQDVKACTMLNPGNSVANQAQHRIQSALRREAQFK
jgi:stress-induced-phosphoprotein 1